VGAVPPPIQRPSTRSSLRVRLTIVTLLLSLVAACAPPSLDSLFGRGGTLRIHGHPPSTLDPAMINDAGAWLYALQIFGGLVRLDDDLEVVPDLAEAIETSPDGRAYTFTLRETVRFHSGRQVVANDFQFAIERALAPATRSPVARQYLGDIVGANQYADGRASSVAGLTVIDSRRLRLEIDGPKSYFLAKMTHPVAFALDRANVETGANWFVRPNGTGPFRMVELDRADHLHLARFADYWAGPAQVAAVEYTFLPVPGIVLYEQDMVDIAEIDLGDAERVSDPSSPLASELVRTSIANTWYVGLTASQPPFDDANVRRAFALATDRDRLVRVLYRGARVAARTILPPGFPGHNPNVRGPAFDPTAAKAALAASRYAGSLPPIIMYVEPGTTEIAEAFAEMYSRTLGIDIAIREVTNDYLALLQRHEAQMFLMGWIADYPHPENFLDILFHTGSPSNYGAFSDPAIDALLERARTESDEGQRLQLYSNAEQLLLDRVAAIPIHHETSFTLVRPHVQNLVHTPLGILSLRNVTLGPRTARRVA
jgi:ABC-type transport system substrate-binding protein